MLKVSADTTDMSICRLRAAHLLVHPVLFLCCELNHVYTICCLCGASVVCDFGDLSSIFLAYLFTSNSVVRYCDSSDDNSRITSYQVSK